MLASAGLPPFEVAMHLNEEAHAQVILPMAIPLPQGPLEALQKRRRYGVTASLLAVQSGQTAIPRRKLTPLPSCNAAEGSCNELPDPALVSDQHRTSTAAVQTAGTTARGITRLRLPGGAPLLGDRPLMSWLWICGTVWDSKKRKMTKREAAKLLH